LAVGGTVLVRDLGSANGTFVNGRPVVGERPVQDGDVVTVGDTRLTFHQQGKVAQAQVVQIGESGAQPYMITRTMRFGRTRDNDIVVDDPRASRHHAEIRSENNQWLIRDLESLNGTFLNGALVAGDQPLHAGDLVVVGGTPFRFEEKSE
jgi:pSer/pThr/pTyr-binding forkhead associated (FHA) protein